jgi:DNA-binding transcriptional regulator YiaG
MGKTKTDTIIYEGLGFPIRLINVPMRQVFSEWVLDINLNQLQIAVLLLLVKRSTRLSGKELRFIRHYLGMSTHAFGKLLGVTHVAVLKWENEERKMGAPAEVFIRLHVLDHLGVTDKEFKKIYLAFKPEVISKKHVKNDQLEIDVEKIAC